MLYAFLICSIAIATVCTVCGARASKGGMIKGIRQMDTGTTQENVQAVENVTMTFFDVPLSSELQQYLFSECDKQGVPAALAVAVMSAESNYQPDVVSSTQDYGLMQINRVNHGWLEEKLEISDFLDPEQNITAGVYILSELWDKYGNYRDVLMAYNLGEGGAAKARSRGVTSTVYSEKVLSILEGLNYCTRVVETTVEPANEDNAVQQLSAGGEPAQEVKTVLTTSGKLDSVASLPSRQKKTWPKSETATPTVVAVEVQPEAAAQPEQDVDAADAAAQQADEPTDDTDGTAPEAGETENAQQAA